MGNSAVKISRMTDGERIESHGGSKTVLRGVSFGGFFPVCRFVASLDTCLNCPVVPVTILNLLRMD